MSTVFAVEAVRTPPDLATTLRCQGVPPEAKVTPRVRQLADKARALYATLADPRGVYAEVTRSAFREIYRGEGGNSGRTPLAGILERANHFALFAVTLGQALSDEIDALFARNEPALAHALDAVASERADAAAAAAARCFLEELRRRRLRGAVR